MRVSRLTEKKTGKTRINIIRSVKNERGTWTTEVYKTLGYLEDLDKAHGDGEAFARAEALRCTQLENERKKACVIRYDPDEIVNLRREKIWDKTKNFGYHAFLFYYRLLGLDTKLYSYKAATQAQYNPNTLFTLLVMNRIISPASKIAAWKDRYLFFENPDYTASDLYRFLSLLATHKQQLIEHINKKVDRYTGRVSTLLYYDVTNYYFEIMREDDFRKKGVSKEHRPNPIIQMGLFMDQEGLPVSYKIYSGNTNDVSTFIESVKELKATGVYDVEHVIFVGDKGMMSGNNVAHLRVQHAGYVISDSVRKVSKEFVDMYILPEKEYHRQTDDAGVVQFKYKEHFVPATKYFDDYQGNETHGDVNERVVIFWSRKYQEKARYERQQAIDKARKLAKNPKSVLTSRKGAVKYTKVTAKEPSSNEDAEVEYELSLDREKILEEERLDGYYMIRTNVIGIEAGQRPMRCDARYLKDGFLQINRQVGTVDIIDMYRGLWKIEESFRIAKSTLETRPVFVWKKEHIESHFLICFVALLLIRLLERDMKGKYPVEDMIKKLREANYAELPNGHFYSLYYHDMLHDIGKKTGVHFNYKFLTPGKIKEERGAINKRVQKLMN